MDPGLQFLAFVEKRGKDVAKMPGTFWGGVVLAVILGGSVGLPVGLLWRGQEVTNANGLLAISNVRIEALEREKADNASIVQQAREAINAIMAEKFKALSEALSEDGQPADVRYWFSPGAEPWAQSLAKAFDIGGWRATEVVPKWILGIPPAESTAVIQPESEDALAKIERAFFDADIAFEKRPPPAGETVEQLWVDLDKNAPPL